MYCSKPSFPFWRPTPLALYPPKGASGPYQTPPLTPTVPARIRRRHRHGSFLGGGGDPHAEAVLVVVGDAHGVVVIIEGHDDQHRSEDLLPGDGHRVVHVGEEGGLDEVALVEVGWPSSADDKAGPLLHALLDVAEDPLALHRADLRALDVGRVGRVAVGDIAEARLDDGQPLFVARAGSSIRVSITQPWPPWEQIVQAMESLASKSVSSRMMSADLPPSSRNSRFRVGAPFSMIRRPTAVEPVNEMRSTRGSVTRSSATALSEVVTTWRTPAGMSVFSATSRPIRVAFQGVFGAAFRITVFPVASDGPSLLIVTSNG